MLATGIRIGEALVLTWEDVDFDNEVLSINKTLTYRDTDTRTEHYAGPTKTSTGNREIPLLKNIVEFLRKKKQTDFPNEHNLLFSTPSGGFLHHGTARWYLCQIAEKADITGVQTHTLRHTFATRGLEQGIELKLLQELLGHWECFNFSVISNP